MITAITTLITFFLFWFEKTESWDEQLNNESAIAIYQMELQVFTTGIATDFVWHALAISETL